MHSSLYFFVYLRVTIRNRNSFTCKKIYDTILFIEESTVGESHMKCTKTEMMNKAIKLFQKNGFEATSVNQICEACNVTKGSFYNYYKSKTDILLDFYNVLLSNFSLSFADLIGIESYREQLWQVNVFDRCND